MKYYFLYLILRMFSNNPLLALLVVLIIYAVIDRRFIGFLPDFFAPWRRINKISGLRKEIEINPYAGLAYYELGALLVEQGKINEGRRYLEKAREMMPEHPEVQFYLGVAYLRSGYGEEAKAALDKALHLNPKVKYGAPYLYLLEQTIREGSDNEQARARIDEYLDKISGYASPEYYFKLGVIFEKAGQKKKAGEMYREAVANFQGYPSFYKKQHRYWAWRAKLKTLF